MTRALLIAGCPYLIVPDDVEVASITWTDEADEAWHVGTSPTLAPWLLCRGPVTPDVPPLVVEESIAPVAGTLDIRSLTLWLADVDDAVVHAFAATEVLPFTRLTAPLDAADTTVHVESTAAFSSGGGVAHVGRERITYAGITATTLTGCVRGTAGTRARSLAIAGQAHRVYAQPDGAAVESLPQLRGRRATVWMLDLEDGVGTDPTLVYDGRVASDCGLAENGAAFEIPIEHALRALSAPATAPAVTLYGYAHGSTPRSLTGSPGRLFNDSPVRAAWVGGGSWTFLSLTRAAGDPDHEGWSASREQFVERLNRASRLGANNIRLSLWSSGILAAYASDGVVDRRLSVYFGWAEQERSDPADADATRASATVYSVGTMPSACLWMVGPVHLDAADLALIPPVPAFPLGDQSAARWTLTAERDNGLLPRASVTVAISALTTASVGGFATCIDASESVTTTYSTWLLTRPTRATLGLRAEGTRWWSVIRYGVLDQLDAWQGLDQLSGSVAWDRVASVATRAAVWPASRRYQLDLARPVVELLQNEARLSGGVLATWRGRLAMAWIREAAVTEATRFAIGDDHLRRGEHARLTRATDGLATAWRLTFPEGDTLTVVDGGAIAESGAGETWSATVPQGVVDAGAIRSADFVAALTQLGAATLAPWVRPYEVVTVPGDLRLADIELGDVGTVSEWCLPEADGSRGLNGRAATVISRSVDFDTGSVEVRARLSPTTIAGYAPAMLVASISGAVCTADLVTVGASGFADDYDDDGEPRGDGGAGTFTPGQVVRLLQLDTDTPATPFEAVVVAVDGADVTLDAAPGSSWEAAAAAGPVMLSFAAWSDALPEQHRWVYVASRVTLAQPDGSTGRRWT